jgi:ferredoxin
MTDIVLNIGSTVALPKPELDGLLADLRSQGYQTIGPRLQDESIVYKDIEGLKDMPRGIVSEQAPAHYRLTQTGSNRYFDFIPAAQSWKQFLFPPRHTLFTAAKEGKWQLKENTNPSPRYALIGVRGCELAAIHVQDRVFLRPDFYDPIYRSRRESVFILAVNCVSPNETCFCTSMKTGPRVGPGFDLCITELEDHFLVEVGSELGRSLISARNVSLPTAFMQNNANQTIARAAERITRHLDTSDLPGLLLDNLEAEHWTDVGTRCLSCANCTLVCPTCFCWDATDQVDILGKNTCRERIWDSCFNPVYSYQAGGNTRPTIRSRYRQWLTHKFGTWKEQFDVLGCVGCGRCITWCPAKIDVVEEINAIREEVKA